HLGEDEEVGRRDRAVRAGELDLHARDVVAHQRARAARGRIAHHPSQAREDRGAAHEVVLVLEIEHAGLGEAAHQLVEIAAVAGVVIAADHVADLLARDRLARVHRGAPGVGRRPFSHTRAVPTMSYPAALRLHATRTPERTALVCGERTLSFDAL